MVPIPHLPEMTCNGEDTPRAVRLLRIFEFSTNTFQLIQCVSLCPKLKTYATRKSLCGKPQEAYRALRNKHFLLCLGVPPVLTGAPPSTPGITWNRTNDRTRGYPSSQDSWYLARSEVLPKPGQGVHSREGTRDQRL